MGRLRYAARLGGEFVAYSVVNRAWWVIPLVLLLAVVALAIVVGQAAAPTPCTPFFMSIRFVVLPRPGTAPLHLLF